MFYAVFSKFWWFDFETKRFTGLLELIKLYKQNPLEEIFIFTIYQNCTLALSPFFTVGMSNVQEFIGLGVKELILPKYFSWNLQPCSECGTKS